MLSRKVLVTATAVLLWLTTLLPTATAPPPPFAKTTMYTNKNLNAKVLVLDFASLTPDTVVDSVEQCEHACKSIGGCNGFVYCGRQEGCGNGCSAWLAGHPKLAESSNDYKTRTLPIESFGAHAPLRPCQGRAWRKGLCSLKKVADPANPVFYHDEPGWKSGVIELVRPWDGSCNGKPFAYCDICSQFWAPVENTDTYRQCMQCGDDAQGTTIPKTLEQATRAFACSWCLTSPNKLVSYENRKQCYACVPKHAVKGLHNLCVY